jgi:Protein of unknown function (DUF3500)
MTALRLLTGVLALAVLVGIASAEEKPVSSAPGMAAAAEKFLDSLTPEQRARALFSFNSPERLNWHYVPLQDKERHATRKGLPLEAMNEKQRTAAMELLKTGYSASGYSKATTIIGYESLLAVHEKGGTLVRNPGWYFFSVFGIPSKTGKWGWRVEGHHVALNVTIEENEVVSTTPAFLGANPAEIKEEKNRGVRILKDEEDFARELYESLSPDDKKVALQAKHFPQIEGKNPVMKVGEPKGIAGAKLDEKQKAILLKLLQSYTDRFPTDVAAAEFGQIKKAGLDNVYFATSGDLLPGKPYTYRVQGPTFLIDFNKEQEDSLKNPANHIHSVFRNLTRDFGVAK